MYYSGDVFLVLTILSGLYLDWLSDKFGRKWVTVVGCIIAAFAYSGIGDYGLGFAFI